MIKKSRRLAPFFRAFAIIGSAFVALACFDSFYDHAYDSSFTPEAFVEETYSPLFFSSFEKYHGVAPYGDTSEQFFFDENIALWHGFLQERLSPSQVRSVLFTDSLDNELELLSNSKNSGRPNQTGQLSGINCSHQPSSAFLDYVLMAKTIQLASAPKFDYWDYENRVKVFVPEEVISEVSRRYEAEDNSFLKQRYWYQAVKARFYGANGAEAAYFFQATENTRVKNTLYYQAMSYAAGALRRDDQLSASNVLYAEIFDKHPRLRSKAIQSFKMMNEMEVEGCVALSQDSGTREAVWAMNGFYTDEKQAIRKILQINPNSPHLDVLLTRMVNKWEYDFCNGSSGIGLNQQTTAALAILDELSNVQGYGSKPLCLMAAAYMHTLVGDLDRSRAFLAALEGKQSLSAIQKDQLQIIRIINKVKFLNGSPSANETALLADLKWLVAKNKEYYEPSPGLEGKNRIRAERALGWVCNQLSKLYSIDGNMEMSELFRRGAPDSGNWNAEDCFSKVNLHPFFKSPANTDKILKFMESRSLTEWERFAVGLYPVNSFDIREYKAILATFRGDLVYAAGEMALAGEPGRQELMGDPFKGGIKDCNDCDHSMYQPVKYTKLDFVKRMSDLSKKVSSGQELFDSHLELANAYYNISEIGNARVFYYNKITGGMSSYSDEIFPGMIGSMRLARRHYELALLNAPNREAMAKCHYMLAKCERNDYYSDYGNAFTPDGEFVAFKEWKGFSSLRSQFSDTRFYRDVVRECGYFRTYLEKKR